MKPEAKKVVSQGGIDKAYQRAAIKFQGENCSFYHYSAYERSKGQGVFNRRRKKGSIALLTNSTRWA